MKSKDVIKFTKVRLPWGLKVHCWGGLGSQLFAWAMAEELIRSGFPRKIELVLHNSGVTRRESEIDQLNPRIKISKVQDFRNINSEKVTKSNKRHFQKGVILISILKKLRIVIFSDEFIRVRPWTLHLRSHYSHRFISKETLLLIRSFLQNSNTKDFTAVDTALHYRLGDLLTLNEKTYIQPERLIPNLNRIRDSSDSRFDVFSDSLEVALNKLQLVDSTSFFRMRQGSAWNTILALSMYKNLISTNSKIGIWGILIRLTYDLEGLIFAPKELESNFKIILSDSNQLGRITFY